MPPNETLSVLDTNVLLALARQLLAARARLSLRTAGHLPTLPELVLTLRLYITRQDTLRLQTTHAPLPTPSNPIPPPSIPTLARTLALAEAAYAASLSDLTTRLSLLNVPPALTASHIAENYLPAHYIASDPANNQLVVGIRGSRELSDLVTNLSTRTTPFLSGGAHAGITQAAYNLHDGLRPKLTSILLRKQPEQRLVIVGHSLGGAVAAALTMLLRVSSRESGYDGSRETEFVKEVFQNAKCFSFSPPPFVTKEVAGRGKKMGIVTVVAGYDIVPRLSAASVDSLLVKLARYDWGADVGDTLGRTVETVTTGLLPAEEVRNLSQAVMQHGVAGLGVAAGAVEQTARTALAGGGERSMLWGMALNATVFVSSMVNGAIEGRRKREEEEDCRFAGVFGMDREEVERVLGEDDNGGVDRVVLAGRIFHLEREFSMAGATVDLGSVPRSVVVEREEEFFREIECSAWMMHDHHPAFIISALESAL